MRFWDSSAIVPMVVIEQRTDFAMDQLKKDPNVIVWWGN